MGRAPCCDKNGLKKGPWTAEEDQKLLDYIQKNGYGNWRTLPKNAVLERCGKSCRLRWTNYLRPDIKRGRFSFEEEETIIQLHSVLGNKWSAIAARLPGRTDNEIKNYWNTHIRKRLLRMGIDPVTHNPRLDLLDLSSILYNSSQINNISRLLGFQPHPDHLLRLATTLLSSSNYRQNTNLLLQNVQEVNQLVTLENQVQNQLQPLLQNTVIEEIPISSDRQAQLTHLNNVEQFTDFNSQILNNWQCSDLPSDVTNDQFIPLQNHYLFGSDDQSILESFGFQTNNFNTLTSTTNSPSNSTYINSSSTSTEDEKESYGSNNMMKFEIPDALGIDCFM